MKKLLQITLLFSLVFINRSFSQETVNPLNELILNNNNTVSLSDYKGKIVLLDFWYRGCLPCLQATPELIELQEKYQEDLIIIGVNDIDRQKDVTDYLNYKKANYFSTYKTEKSISKQLNITSFPTFIIVNQKGEITNVKTGFDKRKSPRELKKNIKHLSK